MNAEEKAKQEIVQLAKELMKDWPSSRNRQKQFVLEYVATGFTNASKAARNAGYSAKTSNSQANRMLTNVDKFKHIQDAVSEAKKAFEERNDELKIASGAEVLQRLTAFGRQIPSEKYYRSKKNVDGIESIEENKYITTPSDEDALRALELLGKNYALFTDRHEVDGHLPVVISGEDELED